MHYAHYAHGPRRPTTTDDVGPGPGPGLAPSRWRRQNATEVYDTRKPHHGWYVVVNVVVVDVVRCACIASG